MNGHIDETRLNDYLDGLLDASERANVDEHIETCEPCAADLAALSDVVAAMGALPTEASPERDGWAEVRGRIENDRVVQFPGVRRTTRRWVSVTVPQLAAAGIALAFLSGGSVWVAMSGSTAGGGPQASLVSPFAVVQTAASAEYDQAIVGLEEILERGRGILSSETLAAVESSLLSIEDAIQDAEEALAEDPDSDLLHRLLVNHQQAKLRVLQQAATATQL